jgi:hydrogenase 3 maturation protease
VLVARKLAAWCRKTRCRNLAAFDGGSAPENVTGVIARFKPTHLVVVDAAHLGLKPGAVRVVAAEEIGGVSFSTHTLPMPIIIDYLAKGTGCRSVVIGIEPEQKNVCAPVSARVLAAVDDVVAALCVCSMRTRQRARSDR